MTKLTLINSTLFVEADFTAQEFKTATAYDPYCSAIKGEEFIDFEVRLGTDTHISPYGITFQETAKGTLSATVEVDLTSGKTEAEAVADVVGSVLNSLDIVAGQIETAIIAYDTLAGQIADTMTIVG